MRILLSFTILSYLLVGSIYVDAQKLKKTVLTKVDSANGMIAKYELGNRYDGYESLYLFRDRKYKYDIVSTGGEAFSSGSWERKGTDIILNSTIRKENVPVKLELLDSEDSLKRIYKTKIQIPINLKGQLLSDSKIFINDTSTYVFPFFDTTVGRYDKISRIKVDFGSGFKSDWISVPAREFKQVIVVAQVDFLFPTYIAFRNKRFKFSNGYLTAKGD